MLRKVCIICVRRKGEVYKYKYVSYVWKEFTGIIKVCVVCVRKKVSISMHHLCEEEGFTTSIKSMRVENVLVLCV